MIAGGGGFAMAPRLRGRRIAARSAERCPEQRGIVRQWAPQGQQKVISSGQFTGLLLILPAFSDRLPFR